MSNKLICPFCQQELKPQTMDGEWLECWNCSYHEPSHHPFPQRILCGTKELWQELIRTRKALDVAVDALNAVTATPLNSRVIHDAANKALEQINEITKGGK